MTKFEPQNPDYKAVVKSSFECQNIMATLGAKLVSITPGRAEIEMNFDKRFTQQHGFLHAGTVTTLADSACGYAALSLMPPDSAILAVEFKVNFLSPAQGERFTAIGDVLKGGKTITVCQGQVFAHKNGNLKLVAQMQATMMRLAGKKDITG